MKENVIKQFSDSIEVKRSILADDELLGRITKAAEAVIKSYQQGGKVLLAGNGGSAADAQHLAAEFVGRFYFDRPGLPSIALSTDTSILTAIGNDYGYDKLFARQVQAQGKKGDVFIGISTSGNSPNIIAALEMCRAGGVFSIGFTGASGGKMKDLCDICINVPSSDTPRIQESHILIGHIICCITEQHLFADGR
jgi:D-sedoheptulose 7-phosphate isomerase